jgi:hypothetical protein
MKEIGTVKIHCISEVATPLTHMMGVSGNESIINREKVLHENIVKDVPVISGNSLRHKIVREPGSLYLIDKLELREKLNIDQANYMFTGGSLSESSTNENLKKIADMQNYFPLFRLLGGSLKNQVIGGSLFSLRGIMICEENREQLKSFLPEEYILPEEQLKSCEHFITNYQYTRGDAGKMKEAINILSEQEIEEVKNKGDNNLMIYNGQAILPGALFYSGFILNNISRLEVGALLLSVREWQDKGSFIGGMSRIGHGKIDMKLIIESSKDFYDSEIDFEKSIEDYEKHVIENKDNCVKWLNDCFPHSKKVEKEAKLI